MLLLLIFILIIASISLLSYVLLPAILNKGADAHSKYVNKSVSKLGDMHIFVDRKKIVRMYAIAPVASALLLGILLRNYIGVIFGVLIGLAVPVFFLKAMKSKRDKKFLSQLNDGIMVLSSSLKGGLNFIQSLEVLCEEMPAPISPEFNLVLAEVKIGATLEDALKRLGERMPSEELDLFISAVSVARETGGDLTKVFARLITTIRDRMKLKETIATYTLQGKMQGMVMSLLPVAFVFWVYKFNPHHFDAMLNDTIGRLLLIAAGVLQFAAVFLIKKFSTIKI